jgi:hypothetical protein
MQTSLPQSAQDASLARIFLQRPAAGAKAIRASDILGKTYTRLVVGEGLARKEYMPLPFRQLFDPLPAVILFQAPFNAFTSSQETEGLMLLEWLFGRGRGRSKGAPGPIAGTGLPFFALAGVYWLVRRRASRAREKRNAAERAARELPAGKDSGAV